MKIPLQKSFFLLFVTYKHIEPILGDRIHVYSSPDANIRFQEVQQNSETGDLFTLDQHNRIYQFSRDLRMIHNSSDGTAIEEKAPLGSQVFILNRKAGVILSCLQTSCGLTRINENGSWVWSPLQNNVSRVRIIMINQSDLRFDYGRSAKELANVFACCSFLDP